MSQKSIDWKDYVFVWYSNNRNVLGLFFIGLFLRLIFLPFVETVDADSTSRLFISHELAHNFRLISNGVWGPIHFYLNAIFLKLFDYQHAIIILKIFTSLLAVLGGIGIYRISVLLFKNSSGAMLAAYAYLLSPIVFRNSFHLLSGIPYAFFIIWGIYFIISGLKTYRLQRFILAGIFFTLACGIRYEGWLLLALFSLLIWINSKFKPAFIFSVFGLLFPVYWMIGNYLATGDFFYGVSYSAVWNNQLEGNNEYIDSAILLERLLFFPFSLWLALTPPLFLALIYVWFKAFKSYTKLQVSLLSIGGILLLVFMVKAFTGSLFLQHRFTISILLLFVPFLTLWSKYLGFWGERIFYLALIGAIPFSNYYYKIPFDRLTSFSYTISTAFEKLTVETGPQTEAIPLLKSKAANDIVTTLQNNPKPLILDYMNWQTHAYFGEQSGVDYTQSYLVDGAKNEPINWNEFQRFLNGHTTGYFLVHAESKLFKAGSIYCKSIFWVDPKAASALELTLVQNSSPFYLYAYKVVPKNESEICLSTLNLPEKNMDYYEFAIQSDLNWLADVRRKSFENGVSLKQQITKDALYMVQNRD